MNKAMDKTNKQEITYACALGIFFTIIIKRSGRHLSENLQYFHFNDNLINSAGATVLLGFIFGTLSVILSYFLSVMLRKKLIKKIANEYPKDKIIFKYHSTVIPVSIAQFAIGGGFFGGYIAPFFIFNNVLHIDMVTKQNLLLYFIYCIMGFLVCVLWQTYTIFLTDKRVIGIACGGSLVIKKTSFLLENISTIKPILGGWEIICNNNEKLCLKFHPCAKKIQTKLKKLLKDERFMNERE